jgi:hypothetical protein
MLLRTSFLTYMYQLLILSWYVWTLSCSCEWSHLCSENGKYMLFEKEVFSPSFDKATGKGL